MGDRENAAVFICRQRVESPQGGADKLRCLKELHGGK